jgi:endonuclease/exonuclease/phosphatase family metal-dependent hydrolase
MIQQMSTKSTRILLLLFVFILYRVDESYGKEKLTVLTYNIWNGYEFGRDTVRKEKLLRWLSGRKADVVAWQELCNYTEDKLRADAALLGHPYSLLLKQSGYSVGVSSRFPILLKERILRGMHHGALHVEIEGIDFFIVHLAPHSYVKRQEEADILLDRLKPVLASGRSYMLMGDFNAHSSSDDDLYRNGFLVDRLRTSVSNQGNRGNLKDNTLDYEVMQSFFRYPLVDVTQRFKRRPMRRGSFPGQVLGSINNETKADLLKRQERIDYILVSPEWAKKCIRSRVCNKRKNWFLSDHYPVKAVFKKA